MSLFFKITNEDIIMTEEDEERYRKTIFRRFCEKEITFDNVRNHCHLTGNYRSPAHSSCNIKVTEKQSNFIPFIFHIFSVYDCQLFFKKLVDKKNDIVDIVRFDIIPKTYEEYNSVTYGCVRFIDCYRFLSSSLDSLAKTLVDISHKTHKSLKN